MATKYTLKNGFSLMKDSIYDGHYNQVRWFVFNNKGERLFSFPSYNEAYEYAKSAGKKVSYE